MLKRREQRGGRAARGAARRAAQQAAFEAAAEKKRKKASKSSKSSSSESSKLTEEETSFVMGLVDNCPKCGRTVRGENVSEGALRQHLFQCQDKDKIAKFAKKKAIAASKEASLKSAAEKQEEMMLEKQW
jgi:protein required for attachment to host cells